MVILCHLDSLKVQLMSFEQERSLMLYFCLWKCYLTFLSSVKELVILQPLTFEESLNDLIVVIIQSCIAVSTIGCN